MRRFTMTSVMCLCLATNGFSDEIFNFDDGTNSGLTEFSFFEPFGLGATFSYAGGNTYRISGPGNPLTPTPLDLVGPNRAAAYPDTTYSDFSVGVDLVDWDDSLDNAVGLLARVTGVGLGTSDGYLFGYNTSHHSIYVFRFDDEAATDISVNGEPSFGPSPTAALGNNVVPVTLDPMKDYRLVFTGDGPNFVGQVYDLDNLNDALATINGTDATYAQGVSGILASATLEVPDSAFDVTFDNLTLSGRVVPEPSTVSLVAPCVLGLLVYRRQKAVA